MRNFLLTLLLLCSFTAAGRSQTLSTWNGATAGSSSGKLSKVNGVTPAAWDGLSFPTGAASLPNLGNSTVQGSTGSYYPVGGIFSASATGTYLTYHIYCKSTDAGPNLTLAVYPVVSGTASYQTLIGSVNVTCTSTAGWVTGTISAAVVSGSSYELWLNGSTNTLVYLTASAATSEYGNASSNYTGSAPASAPEMNPTSNLYSEYLSAP